MKFEKKYLIGLLVIIACICSLVSVSAWAPNTSNYPTTNVNIDGSNVTGKCIKVIDGDTIDVENVGRIRFVGVNTPERGEDGYKEAKDYVKSQCLNKEVTIDVDSAKYTDKYERILGIVYVDGKNLNQELLQKGYAEVMFIPPSEYDPYSWT